MENTYYKDCFYVSKCFSKATTFSIINFLLLSPLIYLIIVTVNSINNYGLAISQPYLLPLNLNSDRAWFLFILVLYAFIESFIIENNIKYIMATGKKLIPILLMIFPFMFVCNLWIGIIKENYLKQYWIYFISNRDASEQISHYDFWLWITHKTKANKLIRNTLLFYITFIISIVGLGFILSTQEDEFLVNDYFIFNTVSFFTQENNFMCFFFLFVFLFLNKKTLFNNNTWLIYTTSYILVVGLVANIMIGPYLVLNPDSKEFDTAYSITKFIWLHAMNPTFFTWFAINSMAQNYDKPIAYKRFIINYLRYPFFYGIYLYSLPFLCNYSVYGQLTNLNPDMIQEQATSGGQPYWIFGAFGILLFLILVASIIRHINIKIVNNYTNFKS